MSRVPSLLEAVQGLLERTYAMASGIDDVARFVVGDRGFRHLYDPAELVELVAGSAAGDGARTLVRTTAEGVRASIYYPDSMIRQLERHPPQRGLDERNVDAFATLIEELDHLLLIAERARLGRTTTMLELELHANVSKHLVLSRFLAGARPGLDGLRRAWLRHHLFDKVRFRAEEPAVRERYLRARRLAVRLVDALPRIEQARRIVTLRRFHDLDSQGKQSLIGRIDAAA